MDGKFQLTDLNPISERCRNQDGRLSCASQEQGVGLTVNRDSVKKSC